MGRLVQNVQVGGQSKAIRLRIGRFKCEISQLANEFIDAKMGS